MKKFLSCMLLFAAALTFTACNGCQKQEPAKPKMVDMLGTLQSDKAFAIDMFGDAEHIRFYECQMILADTIGADVNDIQSYRSVFQCGDTVLYVDHNFVTRTMTYAKQPGHWMGDANTNLDNIKVNFDAAYDNLMNGSIVKPATTFVTFREILGPDPNETPAYYFGSFKTCFVRVDAMTGEVEATE